ncbi:MAG TPA: hypothetical protein VGM87_01830 [Roseomonas sp.]|jgi:hypothetical protein
MSAHFASVLVPESKVTDVAGVADMADDALQALIAHAGEDAPEVANLHAAIKDIRQALQRHQAAHQLVLDRAQLALLAGVAARRAANFGERTAVAMVESCL